MRQIAALPYCTLTDGSMRILLITSRDTRRWVIPKGNRIKGLAGHRAAELEAFEEAGIHGVAGTAPIGHYRYDKRRRNGGTRQATVEVFPLAVTGQLGQWPEQGQRELRWFPIAEAAQAVDEPDLRSIIVAFRPTPPSSAWLTLRRWLQAIKPGQRTMVDSV